MCKKTSQGADGIWDACRSQRESIAARKALVAERVRRVAQALGAVPGAKDGEWQLLCPHCHQITFLSETEGEVFTRGRANPICGATAAIGQRVRDAISK
jgi:hypothetical protein